MLKQRGKIDVELTEFDLSVHSEEDVVRLDVSVDDLVGMQELQGLKTLRHKHVTSHIHHVISHICIM